MAAEVSYNNAWYTFGGGLAKKETVSKSYTPFGELLTENVSGFGYNGEYYNAASGLIYLRARFYAPEMNRFSQKDILRGSILQPGSLNRYAYCINDPVNFVDPSGMRYTIGATVDDGWTHSSSAPAKTSNKSTSTSKGNRSSSSAKSSSSTASSAKTSTSSSAYRGSYVAPGPVQSTSNPVTYQNPMHAASSARSDSKRALDYINSVAPGSPAAYRMAREYEEVQRLAAQVNATHNPELTRRMLQTSHEMVSFTNSVATGRVSSSYNSYSAYDSNGNATSYYNSNYDTGYIPSPDAPRIWDVDAANLENCGKEEKGNSQTVRLTQQDVQNANIENIMKFFGVNNPEDLPELPENAMIVLENSKSLGFIVEGKAIVMDSDKYCEYVFLGVSWSKSGVGLSGKKIDGADMAATGSYVYNVNTPSDYSGVFISSSSVFGDLAVGGALSIGKVYSIIMGGESQLAGSFTPISGTYYFALSDTWIYGEAPISWYESSIENNRPDIREQGEESDNVI